eukprot:1188803-Prorocentrum_minimum.AAC.4
MGNQGNSKIEHGVLLGRGLQVLCMLFGILMGDLMFGFVGIADTMSTTVELGEELGEGESAC